MKPGEPHILSEKTETRLHAVLPVFRQELTEKQHVVGQQTEATGATDECKADLRLRISHFLQTLNMAIDRGEPGFRQGDRTYYGMDANQESLPKTDREADLLRVAKEVVEGEIKRVEAGGREIPMPTGAEIGGLLQRLTGLLVTRQQLVAAFDKESEDVAKMRDDVTDLVKDIWDELEFYHRKDAPSTLRRRCREWGILYVDRTGKEDQDAEAANGAEAGAEKTAATTGSSSEAATVSASSRNGDTSAQTQVPAAATEEAGTTLSA